MPRSYPSSDAFVAAARAAVGTAAPRQPVTLLVATLDDEQKLVEQHGPAYFASLVESVAEIARCTLRGGDLLGVADDNRILMVLSGVNPDEGRSIGERLCAAVRVHAFADAEPAIAPRVTLSIGVAGSPDHGATFENLLATADVTRHRVWEQGSDGAAVAPLAHHEVLRRPLAIDRLAGRRAELTALMGWLDEAAAGQSRVVTVTGDMGTGTATLLLQLESEVRLRGGTMAIASCNDAAIREPYGPWATLVNSLSRLPDAPRREWRELQNLVPRLATGKPVDTRGGSQYRLLEELSDYIRTTSADRLLVLAIDEMQWADPTSWDALEHLVGQLDRSRVMICLAMRPDTLAASQVHRETLARQKVTRAVTLSRLTRDEVKQWLEAAFHRQQVGREFLAFLYRHTEGNPFFIAQLLHGLVEDGSLWHSGERWEWSPVSELRLPAGLPGLIAQRISRFSSSTQAVLAIAAVIGHEFDVDLVAAAGAGSDAAVRLAISEVLSAGLLRPIYERHRSGCAFTHEQVAAVVLDSIPKERRQQLHKQVATALERRGARAAGEIALHYDRAGMNAPAYKFAQLAAEQAERLYALATANGFLHLAARNATSPSELAEVRVKLAHLAETGGRFDEVEELCDLAIEWFEGQRDERRALTLRRMRERARMELGQPARKTIEALSALSDEARDLGFDRERIALLILASQTQGRLGEPRLAEQIASEAVAMAERISDENLLAEALNRLGTSLFSEAPTRAHAIYLRALELYERTGDVRGQARCLGNIGVAAQFEARLEEAAQAYTRSIAVARAAGIPDAWGTAALNLGVLSQKRGEYDRARELFGEALSLFAAVKHSELQLAALLNTAHVERELGLWESAAELYEATISLAQRIGQSDVEIGAVAGAGLCFLELGNVEKARTNALEVQRHLQARPNWFQGRDQAEALVVLMNAYDKRLHEARERLEGALVLAEGADLYCAAWLMAKCANALMDFDAAWVRSVVERYSDRVKSLGYAEMTRRYEVLGRQ